MRWFRNEIILMDLLYRSIYNVNVKLTQVGIYNTPLINGHGGREAGSTHQDNTITKAYCRPRKD